MRVLIAGSSGVIGEALVEALADRGDEVVRLLRPQSPGDGAAWDPVAGTIELGAVEGFDAVVNLAGRGIGDKRWTRAEKQRLWDSRVDSTRLLADTIAALQHPPAVVVNASAVGYYGDGGGSILTESSTSGSGFLADLCVAWEAATDPAIRPGIRVVNLRSGIVLSVAGGALGRLMAPFGPRWLSPFRWGLGGPVGAGRQWWSWISLGDEVRAILHVLDTEVAGPVNLVAPNPVTNRDFTRALGRVLRRPAFLPVPGFALRLLLGSELADALVLEGQRVTPDVLLESGFEFEHPDIDDGLRAALGR
ncbi:MAG: TIGR01777 family oxidoreductase [Acidimicrobiia bacterium]